MDLKFWKLVLLQLIGIQVVLGTPTITGTSSFNVTSDAIVLRKAMKGIGTSEDPIIEIATGRSLEQRLQIADMFNKLHDRDLITDLNKELSDPFSDNLRGLIVALFQTKADFYATTIREAVEDAGTNDQALVDIFCCLNDASMSEISKVYRKKYGKDLITDVKEDVSADFKQLLVALMEDRRQPSYSYKKNETRVLYLAKELVKAGVGIWLGTEEEPIIRIFSESSYEELVDISEVYLKFIKLTLEHLIETETSGYFRELLQQILLYAKDPINHYATLLQLALQNKLVFLNRGAAAQVVTRVLVTRSEIDLEEIIARYEKNTFKPLEKDIQKVFSGDYEKACLKIIRGNK